jgi:hypothetical protein
MEVQQQCLRLLEIFFYTVSLAGHHARTLNTHRMTRRKQYSPVERQGINAVERRVLAWEWIFREQPISDFGVDAEIEICDAGVPLGQLIKLQIKAGSSWFRSRGPIRLFVSPLSHTFVGL